MRRLEKVTDSYGMDSGRTIVQYFLANCRTSRGETAKRIRGHSVSQSLLFKIREAPKRRTGSSIIG
jgi:hypothetical protein